MIRFNITDGSKVTADFCRALLRTMLHASLTPFKGSAPVDFPKEWQDFKQQVEEQLDIAILASALPLARAGSDLRDALLMVDPDLALEANTERLTELILQLDLELLKS